MLQKFKNYIRLRYIDSPQLKREHILTLDLLRGVFMICIVINHAAGWSPSFLNIFTGQGTLFASSAEGFFAISGILVGYIYGPKILKDTKGIFIKLWKRAGLLYILTATFSIIFYIWHLLTPEVDYRIALPDGGFANFLVQTFTLQHAYGWHDFLRYYAIFMIFAPFAVLLCALRKWYVLAAISILIWLTLGHSGIGQPFTSWQIIFMISIIIGFILPELEYKWKNLKRTHRKVIAGGILTGALATYIVSVALFTLIPAVQDTIGAVLPVYLVEKLDWIISLRNHYILPYFIPRDVISIERLLFGVLWFTALYMIFRKYEFSIEKHTRGIISFFGRNSLFIFCLHGVVLFIMTMIIGSQSEVNIFINTLVHALLIVAVYYTAKYLPELKNRIR